MTTKKERREALERMTKAELVKTVLALDKRQVVLLNDTAQWRGKYERANAALIAAHAGLNSELPLVDVSFTAAAYVKPHITEVDAGEALCLQLQAGWEQLLIKPPAKYPWEA